jgi:peptidoglycan/LPS O-acetylase OafA/YrhL
MAPADRRGRRRQKRAVRGRSAVPPASASLRANNFDLIRLFAASQVLFYHAYALSKVGELISVGHFLNYFPGVPLFFVISGFPDLHVVGTRTLAQRQTPGIASCASTRRCGSACWCSIGDLFSLAASGPIR